MNTRACDTGYWVVQLWPSSEYEDKKHLHYREGISRPRPPHPSSLDHPQDLDEDERYDQPKPSRSMYEMLSCVRYLIVPVQATRVVASLSEGPNTGPPRLTARGQGPRETVGKRAVKDERETLKVASDGE